VSVSVVPQNLPALLGSLPFLAQVPPEALAGLAEQSQVRRYPAAETLVRQGDFGHSMFILLAGGVTIHATDEYGETHQVARLDQVGEFFGEVALLGRGARTATVVCAQDSMFLEIEKNHFDRLARKYKAAHEGLESFYHARSIATSLRLHRYLGQLDAELLETLASGATMRKFNRDEVIFRQGEPGLTVLLVRDGVLKMVRRGGDGRTSILAYYNTSDVVGSHDGWATRPADLVALGQAEIVLLPRAGFELLRQRAPEIFARFVKDNMHRRDLLDNAGMTVMNAMDEFLKEGVEVESLLVINLDRCVRCGQCVRACHSRHDFTRLTRRGPIVKRRKQIEAKGDYEHLLIPSSCRHCRDPECMIGCPTGAIQRNKDGEVDINDNCIGCENCARKCPYGNITMMPLPKAQQKPGVEKRAIKCNMCKGYEYSNCVYSCPRGAILRVDPFAYFDELSLVMQGEGAEGAAWKRDAARLRPKAREEDDEKKRTKARSTWFIPVSLILFLLGLGAIVGAWFMAPGGRGGASPLGLGLGVGALALMIGALSLGARRRLLNLGVGSMEAWTQFHMVLGALGFFAAVAHAGFAVHGLLTTVLLAIFALEILTGALGQWIYMTVPRWLTRLERGGLAKLIEDLLEEDLSLTEGLAELAERSPPEVRRFLRGPLSRVAGGTLMRLRRAYAAETFVARVGKRVAPEVSRLPERERPTADRLIADLVRLRDVRAQIFCHRILKGWLVVHLAATGALVVFTAVHVVTMLRFLS
jgi:Fe-S-cluster-containing dehydrogenase component/CRP-like cAMP-binding protein